MPRAKQPQPSPLLDNYEGLARGPALPDGRRAIIVASDDNGRSDQTARVLVLGTVPSIASLAMHQSYAHAHNLFWPFMGELFDAGPGLPYAQRIARLHACGVGIWDVLERCERRGSLDSDIVVMVWEDGGYGLIRWKQDSEFQRHTDLAFGNPDWLGLARAFGWSGHRCERSRDLADTLERAFAELGPSLIVVPIDYRENARLTKRLGEITCTI